MKEKGHMPNWRQLLQWAAAGILAFLCMNLFMFGYYRMPGYFDRRNAATDGVFKPGSIVVNGTEGYAIRHIDSKGYFNTSVPKEPGYILCVGASHTRAWEVAEDKAYPGLLNKYMGGTKDNVKVYNISQPSYALPAIIQNIQTICGEFPESEVLIIEALSAAYSPEELAKAQEPVEYNEQNNGDYLLAHQSLASKLKFAIKGSFPIISAAKLQLANLDVDDAAAAAAVNDRVAPAKEGAPPDYQHTDGEMVMDEEGIALDQALATLRSSYNGRILILYHPSMTIYWDGSARFSQSEKSDRLGYLCRKNQIEFVDVSDSFRDAYAQTHTVPYGFFNTSMGSGHLNEDGHRIIADDLYRTLTGGEAE